MAEARGICSEAASGKVQEQAGRHRPRTHGVLTHCSLPKQAKPARARTKCRASERSEGVGREASQPRRPGQGSSLYAST